MALATSVIERIVAAIGGAELGDVLLRAAGDLQIDEVFAFAARPREAPRPIASSGLHGAFGERVKAYAHRYYHRDPLLHAIALNPPGTSHFALRVGADEIDDPEYRRECFERPRLSEKISFGYHPRDDWFVLNLYRRRRARAADDEALREFAQLALPIMAKHAELVESVSEPLLARVQRRLARHYPTLTAREREVCARTLIGMTAEGIAIDLGISTATALTYRRRAYERLSVSSANQLLSPLLS